MLDEATITQIITALVALIMAIVAWWQRNEKNVAINKAVEANTITEKVLSAAVMPEAIINNDFNLPRDGRILYRGMDGWYARINPSEQAATIPDDKAYQAVSPGGKFYSGNKETIYYLLTSAEAYGWRERNK